MQTIHLQYMGEHPAIHARDVCPGDVMVFNGGFTHKVRSITPNKTGKTLTFEYVETDRDGKHYIQKRRADTLVAINRSGAEHPFH